MELLESLFEKNYEMVYKQMVEPKLRPMLEMVEKTAADMAKQQYENLPPDFDIEELSEEL